MLSFTDFYRSNRYHTRFAAIFSAGLVATLATITLAQPAAAQPLIAGSAGSGTNAYYFALDFRDFSAPQFYAFEFRSNSTSLLFSDVLQGLSTVPTFSTHISNSPQFGLSLDGIAFAGKEKFNFNGNNSGEPNGYWSQWNSPDAISWDYNGGGIGSQPVAAGRWVGASWTANYLTVTDAAPRVALAASAIAPEPDTFTLLAVGGITGAGIVLRRRRRTAGK